jgi:hypothetical protein
MNRIFDLENKTKGHGSELQKTGISATSFETCTCKQNGK